MIPAHQQPPTVRLRAVTILAVLVTALMGWGGYLAASSRGVASRPFNFARLKLLAQELATRPQSAPMRVADPFLRLTYDTYRMIIARNDRALWRRDDAQPFRVQFLPAGYIFEYPAEMFTVSDSSEDPVQFGRRWFRYTDKTRDLAREPGNGFSGLRWLDCTLGDDPPAEFAVFQGASYFRGVGIGESYGASARGLAIDIGLGAPEEFPRFRKFWVEKPADGAKQVRMWALLDSPAVAGAYQFVIRHGESTTMDVDVHLWFRHDVQKLGVAPLTSMWFRDQPSEQAGDARPEVHDSDGLLIQQGDDWTWRGLTRSDKPHVQSWPVERLQGFGLLQRDRDYGHYLDDEANYDKRPSVWVTPEGDWGRGRVELLELPADGEWSDNIGAYWVSDEPVHGNEYRHFKYRVAFGPGPEQPKALLQAVDAKWNDATGAAAADDVATAEVRFQGAPESGGNLPAGDEAVSPVVNCAHGLASNVEVVNLPDSGRTLRFRYTPDSSSDEDTIEGYLTRGTEKISETWSYRWKRK